MSRSVLRFVLLLACVLAASGAAQNAKGLIPLAPTHGELANYTFYRSAHALLVGINQYQHLPRSVWLSYADRDAADLARLLVRSYGFAPENVTVLLNEQATKANIEAAIADLTDPSTVGKEDAVLAFFSGHGQAVTLQNGGKVGYLIPYDADVDLTRGDNPAPYQKSCIRMETLGDQLEPSLAKHWLVVADACFGGLISKGRELPLGKELAASGDLVRELLSRPAQQVLTAGSADQESIETALAGHGLFTGKLLEELKAKAANPDKPLLTSTLASDLLLDVGNAARGKEAIQTPELASLNGTRGQFVFLTTEPREDELKRIELKIGAAAVPPVKPKPPVVESTEPQPGELSVNPVDGAEMAWVPGGEFLMGEDAAEIDRLWAKFGWPEEFKQFTKGESPVHRVRVDGCWMYRGPVTNAQYRKFCQATGHEPPQFPDASDGNKLKATWEDARFNGDRQPVVGVSWEDAQAYCGWAKARLPTEAEWEHAARGTHTGLGGHARRTFAWGDELPTGNMRVGNLADETAKAKYPGFKYIFEGYTDGYAETSPVGAFPANEFNLYDMAGNVWNWCADWYGEDYYGQALPNNPQGPANGSYRVLRGGSWLNSPGSDRASFRYRLDPGYRSTDLGFRLVRTE